MILGWKVAKQRKFNQTDLGHSRREPDIKRLQTQIWSVKEQCKTKKDQKCFIKLLFSPVEVDCGKYSSCAVSKTHDCWQHRTYNSKQSWNFNGKLRQVKEDQKCFIKLLSALLSLIAENIHHVQSEIHDCWQHRAYNSKQSCNLYGKLRQVKEDQKCFIKLLFSPVELDCGKYSSCAVSNPWLLAKPHLQQQAVM